MDYYTMNHNQDNILKITNMITLENSDAINIAKFITIIRGDIDLGVSLLLLFKQQAYEYLETLRYAITVTDKEPHKLFEAAHAIKGAALSVAADKISSLSETLEKQIITKQMVHRQDFDDLIQATQELLNHITMIEMRQSLEK